MTAETTKKARISAKAVTTPELYRYLKRHRLCRKYFRNLKEHHPDWIEIAIKDKKEQINMIVESFTWSETPEGMEFWRKHDKKQRAEE